MAQTRIFTDSENEDIRKEFFLKNGELYRYFRVSKDKRRILETKVIKTVGAKTPNGYMRIRYNKRPVLVHRLVYFLHHGVWPDFIDHINGVRHDNRIENLRSVSHKENCLNLASHRAGRVPRIHKRTHGNRRYVVVDNRKKMIASFTTEIAAIMFQKSLKGENKWPAKTQL